VVVGQVFLVLVVVVEAQAQVRTVAQELQFLVERVVQVLMRQRFVVKAQRQHAIQVVVVVEHPQAQQDQVV
jgi:hypothetical protein